jgi:[FeFe] hydrogenase H-cluster maturation GTPase HydF
MPKTPRGERIVITLTGRRNAGKSSLINALVEQDIAIVSPTAGTTTDPVAKSYELLPLGPVTIYDTAGCDDVGELGVKRNLRTGRVLKRSHIAILVIGEDGILSPDISQIQEIKRQNIPFIMVFNKTDLKMPKKKDIFYAEQNNINFCQVSALQLKGIDELRKQLMSMAPAIHKDNRLLIGDLILPKDIVFLIAPIDLSAPKGRLILPQVQVLREILDCNAVGVIVKEHEIKAAFNQFNRYPDLVITDSQVVNTAADQVPPEVKFTTFSIIFARYKGNLEVLVRGANTIDQLNSGDKVLIAETCSHNVQCDDIGRYKIPHWLSAYTGKDIIFQFTTGNDFPEDIQQYKLIIHCGGCMINRIEMMRRINEAREKGLPITNYGVAISKMQGLLERTLKPFSDIRTESLKL